MSWYYAEKGAQKGPVNEQEFQSLVQSGAIRADTLVWREGMANWVAYGSLGATPAAAPAPTAAAAAATATATTTTASVAIESADSGRCAECGGVFARKDMVAYGDKLVCAGCRDAFFQKVREGVETGAAMNYGGFWLRFVAKIIDSLALMVVNLAFQIPYFAFIIPMAAQPEQNDPAAVMTIMMLNFLLFFLQVGVGLGYSIFFVGRYGATPGKMALSLKVVRADGGKVTYMRAFGRAGAEYLSSMILAIGYIMAGFDEEKRTLHDRICDTRVIRTN